MKIYSDPFDKTVQEALQAEREATKKKHELSEFNFHRLLHVVVCLSGCKHFFLQTEAIKT